MKSRTSKIKESDYMAGEFFHFPSSAAWVPLKPLVIEDDEWLSEHEAAQDEICKSHAMSKDD
jgi:hypothetical protein